MQFLGEYHDITCFPEPPPRSDSKIWTDSQIYGNRSLPSATGDTFSFMPLRRNRRRQTYQICKPMCPCHKGYSIKGRLGSEQRGLDVCLMPRGGQLEKYPPAPPFPRSQDRKRNHKLNQYLESALRNVAAVFVQELNGLRMPSIPSSMPQEGLKGTMSWHVSYIMSQECQQRVLFYCKSEQCPCCCGGWIPASC
ncbi:uncharacterized protein CIMG_11759 [Coccidioides immitis RS]|uniref:Uncharacterized protein n=3 Tax=Coccidioides immitis TaxID=5501 RepID=A0A0D8JTW7_COCIM|nr:uncharacterized protein CIMG_11759 [Coccidioides immitis RS]KJF60584.1 hypothetical protein CIMG_11759 [Coccidioides immitis RS]KMP03595.1 hypothetical protein CIRG_03287 [Coccidioides immitis RMSCC 2394]KMU83088.1 hypothetical protein CIHG_00870 [Coccidioides immitis H538.4]